MGKSKKDINENIEIKTKAKEMEAFEMYKRNIEKKKRGKYNDYLDSIKDFLESALNYSVSNKINVNFTEIQNIIKSQYNIMIPIKIISKYFSDTFGYNITKDKENKKDSLESTNNTTISNNNENLSANELDSNIDLDLEINENTNENNNS